MKRLTAPWTAVLATAALLALPVAGGAQTPQTQTPPEPQPEQSTTLSTPGGENASAAEHLRQAKDALANIDTNNVPARAKSQLASLRRHINALERSIAANDKASATGAAQRSSKATEESRGKTNWQNDVAAIDRIITQLAGSGSTPMTGTGDPGTAGTSGVEPRAREKSEASGTMTLDDATRNQLLEVRTHITAFAAAMSGTASPDAASSQQPSAAGTTPDTAPSAAGTTGQTTEDQAGSATTGQPGSTMTDQTETTAQANVDTEAAKLHLTAARDTLTQLTQLPAAAQLQGEARAQVSQLIQNFNQLITTDENWREVYEKLEANLTALIGPPPQRSSGDPAATAPPTETPEATPADPAHPPTGTYPAHPPTTGTQPATPPAEPDTQGAVGTSGSTAAVTLDPAIRQKLVEFRAHLLAFHAAAGGDRQ